MRENAPAAPQANAWGRLPKPIIAATTKARMAWMGGQKGNVQWPYMRRTTLGEVRRLNKAPTELAPYTELMRCSGTIFGGKANRRQPTVMELTCIIGKFTVNTNVRE